MAVVSTAGALVNIYTKGTIQVSVIITCVTVFFKKRKQVKRPKLIILSLIKLEIHKVQLRNAGFDSRWKLDKRKKKDRTFQQSILLHLLNKKKTHLGTSYDFVHLADLAPVVQKINNPIATR